MSIVRLLFAIILFIPGIQGPSVKWDASLQKDAAGGVEVVLKGEIEPGFCIHPTDAGFAGVKLEAIDGAEIDGAATETFTPSEYKGETVVEGQYSLRQKIIPVSDRIHGSVSWMACSGDECFMREDWEFTLDVAAASVVSDASHNRTDINGKDSGGAGSGLLMLILEAILWGLAMLLTPCVFPMVPMTVSFFLRSPSGKGRATLFGIFIVLLYTIPICLVIGATVLLGGQSVTADIFNWIATHWLPNLLFFAVFMIFAASLLGAFEITLPSGWVNGADSKSGTKGIGGVFFLALTLVLVSFSCTGPIVGTVLIKSTSGEFWAPMVTMLAFSVAFALPFTILALFPSLLKRLPKSGGWLNSVKVVLGFIEIALGLKFLSVDDQTYHWHILSRELYLSIWIVVFSLLGFYLLGKIRFKNDSPVDHIGVGRLTLAIVVFSFVVWLIPGLWGAPLKALSGYLPPLEGQTAAIVPTSSAADGATISLPHGLKAYDNIDDALKEASETGKRVLVDITGYGCVNCREMEARVWSDPEVLNLMRNRFVIAALYNDDKTSLSKDKWFTTPDGKVLKDVGRVNSYIARTRFGVNSQPAYVILNPDGTQAAPTRGYDLDIESYRKFLSE